MTTHELKQFLDKTIALHVTDGEVAKVKVHCIEYE